ncbi:hypothetical protein CYMTET_50258 [Cymbomonas tetramitiformis]|uniref:Uncharacterized protein n=1 Tax=Cymbomonas tetramitiformis TaxID=36881 RepID=A0AAE0ETV5_9CHLO|nr:hypothetical protein CYMTET_50258 [Cymbomonas tetramitiformis]
MSERKGASPASKVVPLDLDTLLAQLDRKNAAEEDSSLESRPRSASTSGEHSLQAMRLKEALSLRPTRQTTIANQHARTEQTTSPLRHRGGDTIFRLAEIDTLKKQLNQIQQEPRRSSVGSLREQLAAAVHDRKKRNGSFGGFEISSGPSTPGSCSADASTPRIPSFPLGERSALTGLRSTKEDQPKVHWNLFTHLNAIELYKEQSRANAVHLMTSATSEAATELTVGPLSQPPHTGRDPGKVSAAPWSPRGQQGALQGAEREGDEEDNVSLQTGLTQGQSSKTELECVKQQWGQHLHELEVRPSAVAQEPPPTASLEAATLATAPAASDAGSLLLPPRDGRHGEGFPPSPASDAPVRVHSGEVVSSLGGAGGREASIEAAGSHGGGAPGESPGEPVEPGSSPWREPGSQVPAEAHAAAELLRSAEFWASCSDSAVRAPGMEASRWGVEASRWGVEAIRWGVEASRWGVEASRRGVEASRWGVEASRWGVEASRWGVEAACPAAIALVERGAVESARHGGDAHRAEVLQERLAHTEAQWQAAAVVAATREAELKLQQVTHHQRLQQLGAQIQGLHGQLRGQGMALVQAQARAQAAGAALLAERQAWHVQVFEARKTAQFLHNKLEHVTAQQANADGAAPARPAAAGALPSQEESQSQAAGTPKMAMPLNEPSPPEAEAASNEHSPPEVEAASNDHSPPEVETASKMCTPPKEESAKTKASKWAAGSSAAPSRQIESSRKAKWASLKGTSPPNRAASRTSPDSVGTKQSSPKGLRRKRRSPPEDRAKGMWRAQSSPQGDGSSRVEARAEVEPASRPSVKTNEVEPASRTSVKTNESLKNSARRWELSLRGKVPEGRRAVGEDLARLRRMHRAAAVLLLSERDLHQQAQEAAEEEIRALMQQMGHLKLEAEHSNRALQQELRDVSIEWQKMVNCNDKKDEAIEKLRLELACRPTWSGTAASHRRVSWQGSRARSVSPPTRAASSDEGDACGPSSVPSTHKSRHSGAASESSTEQHASHNMRKLGRVSSARRAHKGLADVAKVGVRRMGQLPGRLVVHTTSAHDQEKSGSNDKSSPSTPPGSPHSRQGMVHGSASSGSSQRTIRELERELAATVLQAMIEGGAGQHYDTKMVAVSLSASPRSGRPRTVQRRKLRAPLTPFHGLRSGI